MAYLDIAGIDYTLADGRPLLRDVSFRVGEAARVALIGANGAGKTTLLRLITGDLAPDSGAITQDGTLGVMRQFLAGGTVRELLLSVAPPALRRAGEAVDRAERAMERTASTTSQMEYANALTAWGEVGGYEAEVLWDVCTVAALGATFEGCRDRPVPSLSGGEQKRLALEALLRGPDEMLLLDEPDNFLDVPGKRWLEERLVESGKSVLYVSHDRELLARTATAIVTLELGGAGNTAWTHAGGFATYQEAREKRFERLEELRRRWDEEQTKLRDLVQMYKQKAAYNSDMTSRYRAAQTRLARFEEAGPPQAVPREQKLGMRLRGGRTGKRAIVCEDLELTDLMLPFDLEVRFGDRVAVLGSNGSGKSHFLRLLAAGGSDPEPEHLPVSDVPIDPVEHTGTARLGARVRPGWFAQTHGRADLAGRTLLSILHRGDEHRAGRPREEAARVLARYELARAAEQTFDSLSGGQQARFQILLLELGGATLLLLDEPTDNLDLESAEALQQALATFEGTVVSVTHDRWFVRDVDRFLIFGGDGEVYESDVPVWDEGRVARPRA
ncbi:ABC-F family ATP-binding cassette domain-containing protein [Brachybacterium fresconis]|uniref:ATPase subunit of ABC transporter with duplicated ATPase domains n=1 Tax=Brachybacterium fresconis TaxID=173363 RepID=A0ABS4YMF1_9MICO|nr:ATP-binding cassette domain-containing protein [Brachybacterium fresconis]MBP2409986.1 ATPase subunit of ABC transporter with duplicated ATPase domains [Brachybacterium fresconis]